MNGAIRQVIDTYSELLRLHQLNIELLETLELSFFQLQGYCKKNNLPLRDVSGIDRLLRKTGSLLREIGENPKNKFNSQPDDYQPISGQNHSEYALNRGVDCQRMETHAIAVGLRVDSEK